MAAQVEVPTAEGRRSTSGGRLHMSPLTDSSNKALLEIPLVNQSHIITPELNKPVPGPKPRLSPKPFAVEKNILKPILAPKPQTKPRPESTRIPGYRPELQFSQKTQPPAVIHKPKPSSNTSNRPQSTSFRTSTKFNTGQTVKPVAQPFKPAPILDSFEPSKPSPPVPKDRQKPGSSSLGYSKSLKSPTAAEWSGIATKDKPEDFTFGKGGASMTRAKSLGFLAQLEKEEEVRERNESEDTSVVLRPHPRGSRLRPVSAVYLDSPTKMDAPVAAPRWAARRPLSADLTSKFESIGLSLHRNSPKSNTKENTPEDGIRSLSQSSDGAGTPTESDRQIVRRIQRTDASDSGDIRHVGSIKSRISLLLDSSASPGSTDIDQMPDLCSPVQDGETSLGVKHLIKQLTVDSSPTLPAPNAKPTPKPRPLPLDLSRKFSEGSPDLGTVFFSETTEGHEFIKDPQRRNEDLVVSPKQKTLFELQENPKNEPLTKVLGSGLHLSSPVNDGAPQTVRASLFDNVIEKHSVMMVDDGKPAVLANPFINQSIQREKCEDEDTLVTATYKPISPSSPLQVVHSVGSLQTFEASTAVSESIPTAQWENKAMTLRTAQLEEQQLASAKAGSEDQGHRYLRIGSLQRWNTSGLDQQSNKENGLPKPTQKEEGPLIKYVQNHVEQDDKVASPKRLKILQPEDSPKPRATYFALTGQIQEPSSTLDVNMDDDVFLKQENTFMDKGVPLPNQEFQMNDSKPKSKPHVKGVQETDSFIQVEKKNEQKLSDKCTTSELEKDKRTQLELEKREHLEFTRMKEREKQREFERQRQISYEKEKQVFEEKQQALEKGKQLELEKQMLQDFEQKRLEKQRQTDYEKEARLRELERKREEANQRELARQRESERQMVEEKQKEAAKNRELERQRMEEMQREAAKQRELARQRELDRQRAEETQREQAKQRELARQRELERQRVEEMQKEVAKQRELARQKELQKQRAEEMLKEEARLRDSEKLRAKERQREKEDARLELERHREDERQKELERQRRETRRKELERHRQKELDKDQQLMEIQMEKQRMEELERIKELERIQLFEFEKQRLKEKERQNLLELEKQQFEKKESEKAEKMKQMALEQEMLRLKELDKERERQREKEEEHQREIEQEKQRQLERRRQRDLDKERQKKLDIERQELDNQRIRQQELEKERRKKEEMELIKEMEKRRLLEFEKQKQAEKNRTISLEMEQQMEKKEAEKIRMIARRQEVNRQRLMEKQKNEEKERIKLDSSPLRPTVVDLDLVLQSESLFNVSPQSSDPSTRWKEPSPRSNQSYKPSILDIDSYTSHSHPTSSKNIPPVSINQNMHTGLDYRSKPEPERDLSWKVPSTTTGGLSSPVWTQSPQDPWDLQPFQITADKLVTESRHNSTKPSPELLLLRQEERHHNVQIKHPSSTDSLNLTSYVGTEAKPVESPLGVSSSLNTGQIWFLREPKRSGSREDLRSHRRSEATQELNRLRSRSVSRRSAPSSITIEGMLPRMRSRSSHREQDRQSFVQQKQGAGDEEGKDPDTPLRDSDSQYGTWETGLRTDDSLTPATPSSDSTLSPSPRRPTPVLGEQTTLLDSSAVDGVSPENQTLSFPDAPIILLDTSALRSRAQLGKKRAARTRPTRAARQKASVEETRSGEAEDWLYRDSTEEKVSSKDSDGEEQSREGADASVTAASQPQRVALFPGVDPSALKVQLRKRGDPDTQVDSPSHVSRSPKSPFLPRAARVLPPPGGKENGEEKSPQWLKELKSKKRLSQYESES